MGDHHIEIWLSTDAIDLAVECEESTVSDLFLLLLLLCCQWKKRRPSFKWSRNKCLKDYRNKKENLMTFFSKIPLNRVWLQLKEDKIGRNCFCSDSELKQFRAYNIDIHLLHIDLKLQRITTVTAFLRFINNNNKMSFHFNLIQRVFFPCPFISMRQIKAHSETKDIYGMT